MADRKLFIGNLVRRITQEDLWVMYSAFGPLEECAKFHESFGFVRFLHAEDARQALDATHGITLKGRCIKVEFAATTTSWRSANNSCCNECRSSTRYNIPPIRAVDLANYRGHYHTSFAPRSPPRVGPIGHRKKTQAKTMTLEKSSTSTKVPDVHTIVSSPPSSYAASSSSHIAEIDDYDCELDSGYNDEFDSPVSSTSPWSDTLNTDEMFIWDFQLYADIAREPPSIKIDFSSSECTDDDDDTCHSFEHLTQFNIDEYL
ncbi:unnamed protein product [Adineta ricciae]|uniref:RRM domain-containing protein n=1 Tax=Adineta ricciae TaxID=249248 RepID=A0A815LH66_ADIRI|nr:unnamed protein product [Adineta ricciae]CAF1409916.1 unnamed protein product [Adineta ricciae]